MKTLLIIAAIMGISGCSVSMRNFTPTCMDGYLVGDFVGKVRAFCVDVDRNYEGILGTDCSDLPDSDTRVVGELVLKEGVIEPTKCFNTQHGHDTP